MGGSRRERQRPIHPPKDDRQESFLLLLYMISQELVFTTNKCSTNSCKAQHAPVFPMKKGEKELPPSNHGKMRGEGGECF